MQTSGPTTGRKAVGRLARLQGGCVARWQLRFLGLNGATLSRLVHRDGWGVVHGGVYRLPGVLEGPLSGIWAAVLAVSPQDAPSLAESLLEPGIDPVDAAFNAARQRAVVTGLSAAWLRNMADGPPPVPQLLLTSDHHPRRTDITIVRGTVDRDMWSWVDGLQVAAGPRLLWDVAWLQRRRRGAVDGLVDLIVTADRLRILAVDEVLAVIEESVLFGLPQRVPRPLRDAAEEVRPGFSHSKTEALAREIATEQAGRLGLTVEARPWAIRSQGRIIAEADLAVVALRHDAEIDGPHHDLRSQQARDRRRDALVHGIDWTVARYPVAMIDASPTEFADRYRRRLQDELDAFY